MADQDGRDAGLQFERADFGSGAAAMTCAQCTSPIATAYWEANGKIICEACRYKLEEFLGRKAGFAGALKALAAGVAAGIVGWIIYYAVLALTGYEFGLIAIVVGYIVGRAVRWGSGHRGGAGYQALAIVLTYVTIVSTYVPLVIKSIRETAAKETAVATVSPAPGSRTTSPSGAPAPAVPAITASPESPGSASPVAPQRAAAPAASQAPQKMSGGDIARALAMFGVLILALPFLQGFQNIIGIAIIAFALFEAWKLNRRIKIAINGPFTPGAVART